MRPSMGRFSLRRLSQPMKFENGGIRGVRKVRRLHRRLLPALMYAKTVSTRSVVLQAKTEHRRKALLPSMWHARC